MKIVENWAALTGNGIVAWSAWILLGAGHPWLASILALGCVLRVIYILRAR
jgi:hypothetical protein